MILYSIPIFLVSLYYIIRLLRNDAIFIPTPKSHIEKVFRKVGINKNDIFYDLGSGDGRVVLIVAQKFGCKAIGIESNPILYYLSLFKLKRKSNLKNRIKFYRKDIFEVNLSNATVIYTYLSKKLMKKLKEKFEKELKKGAKIVSLDHKIPGWREKHKIKLGKFFTYYVYVK